jgi:hypothetical protein
VSGQNFNLEDLDVNAADGGFGENVSGAPSLSAFLQNTTTGGGAGVVNLSSQTQNATINMPNNSAFASNSGGLRGSSPTITGTPFAITLGSDADIVEYTLTPASGIQTIAGFGANDELNINMRGAPDSALQMVNNGASSVSIFSNLDPTHGVVLLGEQKADLQTSFMGGLVGQGHALITLA